MSVIIGTNDEPPVNITFSNGMVNNCGGDGIFIDGSGCTFAITGCSLLNNGGYGVNITGNNDGTIEDTNASGSRGGFARGGFSPAKGGGLVENITANGVIEDCTADNCSGDGIFINGDGGTFVIDGCNLRDNDGYGVRSNGNNDVTLTDIDASGSLGSFAVSGFSTAFDALRRSTNITIENCIVGNCTGDGIRLDSVTNATVTGNTISGNGNHGISLNNSTGNTILYNTFVNNTEHAYDNGNNTWCTARAGNYWDDYTGSDSDGDGIGDTPYVIPGGDNQDGHPLIQPPLHMDLCQGWNLITIPSTFTHTACSLGENISGCSIVAYWNATLGYFQSYLVGISPPAMDFTVHTGIGYFLYLACNSTYPVIETPEPSVSVTLSIGWNTIGWYNQTATNASSLGTAINNCTIVAYWNASSSTFASYLTV